MALEGTATVNGHELTEDNMVVLEQGVSAIEIEIHAGSRLLLLGGEPFESQFYCGGTLLVVLKKN